MRLIGGLCRETKTASISLWRRRSLKWKNSNGGVSEIENQLVQGWKLITPVGAPPEAVVDNIENHPAKWLRKEDQQICIYFPRMIWLLAFLKSSLYKNYFGNFFYIFKDWFFHSPVSHFLDPVFFSTFVIPYLSGFPILLQYRSAFSSFPHNLKIHVRFSLCSCFNTLIIWLFQGPIY